MDGLYHLGDLATEQVLGLVRRGLALRGGEAPARLPGRSLGLLFLAPSLRTQASFQRAAARLGLELVQLSGGANGMWGLEFEDGVVMDGDRAEHVREAAAVLGRYVDVLAVRAFPEGRDLERDRTDPVLRGFRAHAGVPVVNMESARWHPCQALADWITLEQLAVPPGGKLVLTWAWHPRALPQAVPASTLCMAAQRGMDAVLLRPEGYDLLPETLGAARALARASGGRVTVTDDRAALEGAHVVYAKSWASLETYGDAEAEARQRAPLRGWCVDESWMRAAGATSHFFHCLPVRRNVVVRDEVLDGPRSAVVEQAENRLHAQTAVLEALLTPSGAAAPGDPSR